jgi:glycerol uptake facilitator-like aquaporin
MVFAITDPNKTVPDAAGPVLVGGTVATLILGVAPLTGCGMNPARDLGPRLVTAAVGWGGAAMSPGFWIYTAGPFAGAVLGGALYNMLLT